MKRLLMVTIAYLLALTPAFGASEGVYDGAGTATAQFLKIPTNARYQALGGAYAAIADDAAGLYGQPAAALAVQRIELSGTHNEWLSDVKHEYLSFAYKLDADRAVSAQVTYLGVGGFERTDEDANGILTTRGGSFDAADVAIAIGYAQRFNRQYELGGTFKYLRSTIDGIDANAVAFDGGVRYHYDEFLTLGASVTNLGTEMKFISTGNRLPLTWRFGAAYRYPTNAFFDVIVTGDAIKPIDANWAGRFGLECAGDFWALRGGYRTDDALDNGWSLGAGLKLFDSFKLDYAWAPGGALGNTQFFSASYCFQ